MCEVFRDRFQECNDLVRRCAEAAAMHTCLLESLALTRKAWQGVLAEKAANQARMEEHVEIEQDALSHIPFVAGAHPKAPNQHYRDENERLQMAKAQLQQVFDFIKVGISDQIGKEATIQARIRSDLHPRQPWQPKQCEARTLMKRALLQFAYQSDRTQAQCAEALGHLFLRTPLLFKHGDIAFDATGAHVRREGHDSHTLIAPPSWQANQLLGTCPLEADAWKMLEHIDELVSSARMQDSSAIVDLINLLMCDDVPEVFSHHLVTSVLDTLDLASAQDEQQLSRTRRNCAVIAYWSNLSQPPSGPPDMVELWHKIYDIALFRSRERVEAGVLMEDTSSHVPDEGEIEREFTMCLAELDAAFTELRAQDPLLHITDHIVDLLQHVSKRRLEQLKREEFFLYGAEAYRYNAVVHRHWTLRRQAAARVCELAASGHHLAGEMLRERLIRDQHWLVQDTAVGELCRIVGVVADRKEFLQTVGRALFDVPGAYWRPERSEDEKKQVNKLQAKMENALIKELPLYSPSVRRAVLDELVSMGGKSCSSCNRVIKRILRAGSGAPDAGTVTSM